MMRILLLTDSLGCPRNETPVSDTWVDKILNRWSGEGIIFYTYCKHGLSAKMIDIEYIKEICPDIIITQIGIVDACRRALTKKELFIYSHIPLLDKNVNSFCRKHHFFLTRLRNIHDCNKDEFIQIIKKLKLETRSDIYFIKIAQAGDGLKKRIYHVTEDIDEYNCLISKLKIVKIVDPYGGCNPDLIVLDDGHHLNEKGLKMVEKCVSNIIQNAINASHSK